MKDFKGIKILSENKKAYFDYEILEKFEAGMVLSGQEVKSIKSGKISLKSSYVVFNGQEPFLIGAKVPAYQPKNAPSDYDPEKSRKLLLKKTEIKHLIGKVSERGIALIPLKIYVKNAMVKLEFGIAKGRKKFSKKEMIKKRENQREVQRELKSRGWIASTGDFFEIMQTEYPQTSLNFGETNKQQLIQETCISICLMPFFLLILAK